ncbi:unnamed protein product [Mucor hiemalis]
MAEFEEGGETILTIKDRNILEEDDEDVDELTNVNIEDRERLKKNLDLKKQKPGYNPYDDDQFNGSKHSILPQYEDDDAESGFVIGKSGTIKPVVEVADEKTVSQKLKEQTLSYEKMQEIKDYYTQEEVNATFKKPKNKKKKKTRRRNKDEDDVVDIPSAIDSNLAAASTVRSREIDPDANFVDDDDLQEALARARRVANKEKNKLLKKMTPEEIAKQIREEEASKMDEDEQEGGLILSEATEFVNALGNNIPTFTAREPVVNTVKSEPVSVKVEVKEEDLEDTVMEDAIEEAEDSNDAIYTDIKKEEEIHVKKEMDDVKEPMVEEPLVSSGLAATLSLLNQKGVIAKPTEEQLKRDKIAAEQIRWQNEQRKKEHRRALEEKKEKERRRGNDRGRDRDRNSERAREAEREREREKEREDTQRMREYELAMQNYKPEVNLEYTDDTGRVMKTAEAFRYMSHKFHGKTSGKTKTEKRMQKIEEERKLNMMSSTDTPHNLASALLERQQRTGAAHVVLSVGKRGVVPPTAPTSSSSSKPTK